VRHGLETALESTSHVFISGATSGIGLATARRLVQAGYHVIAGCFPGTEAGQALKREAPERVSLIQIDVANAESVAAACSAISEIIRDRGLSGLVNSAGIVCLGPAEHLTVDEFQRVMNVNLVGTFSVTRSLLPALRKAAGTVVNISSDAGILPMPAGAAYCASKFGVEAFSDALRGEVRAQQVKVAIIEPGNINTPIWDTVHAPLQAKYDALSAEQKALYGKLFLGLLGIERQGIAPEQVAETIHKALTAKRPKARYRVGMDCHVSKLISFLPARMRDSLALKVVESYANK
jgi:NAD(P)-dependent dehydrogenase (short-subunit alcohol dehydrogenase family)